MRKILRTVDALAASDGDGVKIHRLAGRHLHVALNPYLMIDEINSDDAADYIGGFPEHPHRGFETITYMKAGRMRHRDHMGNVAINGHQLVGALPRMSTEPVLMDVQLSANGAVELSFKADNPALAYVYQGESSLLKQRQMGVYSRGEKLRLEAGSSGAKILVLSGRPLDEPIVQYGPFVMNSSEEIEQALRDFQSNQSVSSYDRRSAESKYAG